MNEQATEAPAELVYEYALDAPPGQVWRAISIPELREQWLPAGDLAQAEPVSSVRDEEIRYRLRDVEPPHLQSVVTFQVRPGQAGGSVLRIIHALADARLSAPAANDSGPYMLAA